MDLAFALTVYYFDQLDAAVPFQWSAIYLGAKVG